MKLIFLSPQGIKKFGVTNLVAYRQEIERRETYLQVTSIDSKTYILEPLHIHHIEDLS